MDILLVVARDTAFPEQFAGNPIEGHGVEHFVLVRGKKDACAGEHGRGLAFTDWRPPDQVLVLAEGNREAGVRGDSRAVRAAKARLVPGGKQWAECKGNDDQAEHDWPIIKHSIHPGIGAVLDACLAPQVARQRLANEGSRSRTYVNPASSGIPPSARP